MLVIEYVDLVTLTFDLLTLKLAQELRVKLTI